MKGVCEAIGSACATGLGNIGYAYRLIKFGIQDRVVAGGVEGTSLETFIGFDAMQVLSKGFTAGESSAAFRHQQKWFCMLYSGAALWHWKNTKWPKPEVQRSPAVIDNYHNNSDGAGNMFFPSFSVRRDS